MNRWLTRGAALLCCWLAATLVLVGIGSAPSWPGLLAAFAAVGGLAWAVSDASADMAQPDWQGWHAYHRPEGPSLDGRLGALRRIVDTAGVPPTDGATTRPAAAELQRLLRDVTQQRLRARGSSSADLPDDLADYLRADPAPLVPQRWLDQLLTRIEAL